MQESVDLTWMQIVIRILSYLLLPILFDLYRRFMNNHENDFNEAVFKIKKIDELLYCTMKRHNAKRAFVFSYHNGGKYYSGESRQKVSMSHEVTEEGVPSIIKRYRDIPISHFSDMTYKLSRYGKINFTNVKDTKPSGFRKWMNENDVKSHCAIAVYRNFFTLKNIFKGQFYEKRMIHSIHMWFPYDVSNIQIDDYIIADKLIHELKTILHDKDAEK